ncbi:magnesium transporter [Coprococcus comes]|uniref:Magnesium transporter MgtE n=1 Tax=Coprococcus comes TaxID=410072 RepID=A0A414QVV0_9FIRM|nr:magnesium transporter [Coprococcus comes]RHF84926.1 magnesium transporter [Coprococcus comes]
MENTQDYQDYRAEILGIVRSNASPGIMRNKLEDYHENDLADVFPDLSVAERRKLCRILNLDMLADIFEYIDEKQAAEYLDEMDVRKAAAILSRMETDAVVDVLRMIPKEKRALLLELMDDEARKDMAVIAAFDDEEIGSRMTTNYIEIRENLTVKQAMTELVSQAAKNDNISTIFMVTADHTFYGAMDLKDLITARQDTRLEDLIVTSYPYVYGHELIDDCIEKLKDYSENSIPILDNDNKLLGVITSQSIVDLVDDEMGEDYAMFAGLTAEEDLKEPLKESMKKRLPWLLVLLALGTVVSSVVGVFEQVVSQLTIIMCFQSLILDMAGNVGTQSLAVTIRVLMDESLTGKQKVELVFKEMRIAFSNGAILGILSFLVLGLYIALFKGKTWTFAYAVSGCIGLSLMVAMVISGAVGTLIPLFFKKINIDPAVASGPLITTINDLVAVVAYYGLCGILLIGVLHLAG